MSSKLITESNWQHDFRDDLESSIYVLLWTTLMYSECSDPMRVGPFMEGVLDPRPYGLGGGYGKADFLKGMTFLDNVTFPDRPALHWLVKKLGNLFAIRYISEPESKIRDFAKKLQARDRSEDEWGADLKKQVALGTKDEITRGDIRNLLEYDERKDLLKDHDWTIGVFDTALADRWPDNDAAVKQTIHYNTNSRRSARHSGSQHLRTDWSLKVALHHKNGDSGGIQVEEDPADSNISSGTSSLD